MLKRFTKTLTLLMAYGPLVAFAEFKNASYSYFALGSEQTNYTESLDQFAGTSFKSDFTSSGLSQSSGGYTSLAEDSPFGFFIATQSTLLAKENEELRKQLSQQKRHIQNLEEFINSLKHKQFGSSSEKCDDQIALFNEAEQDSDEIENADDTESIDVPAHKRKKKKEKRKSVNQSLIITRAKRLFTI